MKCHEFFARSRAGCHLQRLRSTASRIARLLTGRLLEGGETFGESRRAAQRVRREFRCDPTQRRKNWVKNSVYSQNTPPGHSPSDCTGLFCTTESGVTTSNRPVSDCKSKSVSVYAITVAMMRDEVTQRAGNAHGKQSRALFWRRIFENLAKSRRTF